jgi:hypothetical protein
MPLSGRVAIIAPPHSTRTTIARGALPFGPKQRPARRMRAVPAGPAPDPHSKLLNMRDFRARSGFPLAGKTRYNLLVANRREPRLGLFSSAWLFVPRSAIGQAKFRAYMLQTHT